MSHHLTIPRDPTAELRTRRALDRLVEVLNDLIASDSITKDSNGTWITNPAITPATASFPPSGVFEMGGDQDETKIIPGPKGDTGATGATGATGPTGPAGSSGSGGSSIWMPPDFEVEEAPRLYGAQINYPNDTTKFLNGAGAFAVPAGTGATSSDLADYTRRAIYLPFTPGTNAYEFTGSDLSNFTAVNSGSHTVVATESNDQLSLLSPGSDASAELHAWMKTATINANAYVEAWFEYCGKGSANLSAGVIMSDGHTYGAGNQVYFDFFGASSTSLANHTNFSTAGTATNNALLTQWACGMGIRLVYLGSNNWAGYVSKNGIDWVNITGTLSRTMTPTEFGFFVSTWGAANAALWTVRYVRFVP
jgi:hypothetical protein